MYLGKFTLIVQLPRYSPEKLLDFKAKTKQTNKQQQIFLGLQGNRKKKKKLFTKKKKIRLASDISTEAEKENTW